MGACTRAPSAAEADDIARSGLVSPDHPAGYSAPERAMVEARRARLYSRWCARMAVGTETDRIGIVFVAQREITSSRDNSHVHNSQFTDPSNSQAHPTRSLRVGMLAFGSLLWLKGATCSECHRLTDPLIRAPRRVRSRYRCHSSRWVVTCSGRSVSRPV